MNDKEFKLADRIVLKLKQYSFAATQEVRVKALEELNGEEGSPGLFSQWENLRREKQPPKPKSSKVNNLRKKLSGKGGGNRGSSEQASDAPPPLPPQAKENPRPPKNLMEVSQVTEEYSIKLIFESVNHKDATVKPLPVKTESIDIGSTANVAPVINIPEPTEEMKKHKLTVNQVRVQVFRRVV